MDYMKYSLIYILAAFGILVFVFPYFVPSKEFSASISNPSDVNPQPPQKTTEELITEALEKSSNIKGVYMTSDVARDQGRAATRIRENIKKFIHDTELNGVVVDIKESNGVFLDDNVKKLIQDLHKENVWVIARIVAFRDSETSKTKPEFFIKKTGGGLWRDNRGGTWMDPADTDGWNYLVGIGKRAIDIGFDELQFDYVRFPSDGNLASMVYPRYDYKIPKHEILRIFFSYLHRELKLYKPDIILSADLFGYVASRGEDQTIGQRVVDIRDSLDYVSFMVYPSHYYAGFEAEADPERNLAAVYFPYRSKNINEVVSNHPYETIYRSLLRAKDFLEGKLVLNSLKKNNGLKLGTSTVATTTISENNPNNTQKSSIRVRPWLQDFDLGADTSRGIYYGVDKVRAEIKAAEDSGSSGWLLWNASNVYTEDALKKE